MRRVLAFDNLGELIPEVRRLIPGHRTVGQWTLAQVCRHLAGTINGSMDGFNLRRHRVKRFFLSKRLLRYTYRHGITPGYTVDPKLTPPPHLNLDEEAAGLEQAVERYRSYRGRLRAHPLFGDLSRQKWDQLHCFHAAHHLSFVISTDE